MAGIVPAACDAKVRAVTDLEPRPRRVHPFGRSANVLVHVGATLALANSAVLGIRFGAIEYLFFRDELGANAGVAVAHRVVVSVLVAWLAWRALMAWRARSLDVIGRLLVAGLVMMPLGPFSFGTLGIPLSSAGLALAISAMLARPKVLAAEDERLGRS